MNRFSLDEVSTLLSRKADRGLRDLWDAVPPGYAPTADALASLRRENQTGILQELALRTQQATAAAGLGVGFRPEVFDKLKGLPGIDVLTETATLALQGNLDIGDVTEAGVKLVVDIITKVGKTIGIASTVVAFVPYVGVAVSLVMNMVTMIVTAKQQDDALRAAEAQANLACTPPAFGVALDGALSTDVLALMRSPNWERIFQPIVRVKDPAHKPGGWGTAPISGGPTDLGWLGFACCRADLGNGSRVIMPIGSGIGNKFQRDWRPVYFGDGPGFGCLPMCDELLVHRGIVVPGGGMASQTYDPANSLPQLGGLGAYAWRLLWGGGPAAFTVDGASLAAAWSEYIRALLLFIGQNTIGIGGLPEYDRRVCDYWNEAGRHAALRWFLERIGLADADPSGIIVLDDALPVRAWLEYEQYQEALLERTGIAYVDPDTCHPAWRSRVLAAHTAILQHDTAVCELDELAIPNLAFRQAVHDLRREKGAWCFAVAGTRLAAYSKVGPSQGPSLAPLVANPRPLPTFPTFPTASARPSATSSSSSTDTGSGAIVAALFAAGLIGITAWAVTRK